MSHTASHLNRSGLIPGVLISLGVLISAVSIVSTAAAQVSTPQNPPGTPGQQGTQARNENDIRFRLAQSYERSGDFENAVLIYEELLGEDSTNFTLIESLRRGYLQLKRHADAAGILEHSLRLYPTDINAYAQLGIVYMLGAEEEKAAAAWEKGIALDPRNETAYRIIGSAMVQSRAFERAVKLYSDARTLLARPDLFTSDIAYLYGIMLKYEEAAAEYVKLIVAVPTQLNFVQSRMAGIIGRPEGLSAATSTAARAADVNPTVVELRRLLGWLQMEAKDFDGAYKTYTAIDKMMNAGGNELFAFAELAFREKSYTTAAAAYEDLVRNHDQFRTHPDTRYGHARALEEIALLRYDSLTRARALAAGRGESDEDDQTPASAFEQSLGEYAQIVFDFPRTEIAAKSLLRTGLVWKRTGDAGKAKQTLEAVVGDYKIFKEEVTEARLELGEIYLSLGDVGKSRESYEAVSGRAPFAGREREEGAFCLAEVLFFEGKYGEALVVLNELVRNTRSESANDAIGLQILIRENEKRNPEALRTYASAELARRQKNYDDALEQLRAFTAETSDPPADLFMLKEGDILAETGRLPDAARTYQTVIDSFPRTVYGDRALFAIAQLHDQAAGNVQQAIDAYQKLLEQYPSSIFANRARKRIRDLRGDNT